MAKKKIKRKKLIRVRNEEQLGENELTEAKASIDTDFSVVTKGYSENESGEIVRDEALDRVENINVKHESYIILEMARKLDEKREKLRTFMEDAGLDVSVLEDGVLP